MAADLGVGATGRPPLAAAGASTLRHARLHRRCRLLRCRLRHRWQRPRPVVHSEVRWLLIQEACLAGRPAGLRMKKMKKSMNGRTKE